MDELRRWDWAPRSVHQSHKRITLVASKLSEHLEREPTEAELASALGLEENDLSALRMQAQARQMVSFDEVSENGHGDDTISLTERLPDPQAARPDAGLLSEEDRVAMRRCLASLPKTQAHVIVLHYLQNVPLREVARTLAVTPSRVSQLHHQGLARLKWAWRKSGGD